MTEPPFGLRCVSGEQYARWRDDLGRKREQEARAREMRRLRRLADKRGYGRRKRQERVAR